MNISLSLVMTLLAVSLLPSSMSQPAETATADDTQKYSVKFQQIVEGQFHRRRMEHQDAAQKRLFILAGPHQTGSNFMMEFFRHHASKKFPHRRSEALNGWNWPHFPHLEGGKKNHKNVMDQLVTKADNATLQKTLHQDIRKAWRTATRGVVMGSEKFDQTTAADASSPSPASLAIEGVIEALSIQPEQVTVFLNYWTPRLAQWVSLWRHTHMEGMGGKDPTPAHYKGYICGDDQGHARWNDLDTTMNPFGLAKFFRYTMKYKVVMLDTNGIVQQGQDLAHVMACHYMVQDPGNNCTSEGFLVDKAGKTYTPKNMNSTKMIEDFTVISEDYKERLEAMFLGRDCYLYGTSLQDDDGFSMLIKGKGDKNDAQSSFWPNCDLENVENDKHYQQLASTDFLLNEIRAEKKCGPTNDVEVKEDLIEEGTDMNGSSGMRPNVESEKTQNQAKNGETDSPWNVGMGLMVLLAIVVVGIAVTFVVVGRRRRKRTAAALRLQISTELTRGSFLGTSLEEANPEDEDGNNEIACSKPECDNVDGHPTPPPIV